MKEYVIKHPSWISLFKYWNRKTDLSIWLGFKPYMFVFGLELGESVMFTHLGPLSLGIGRIKEKEEKGKKS